MGLRLRKQFKIFPGVKLNITKNGISSVSIGKSIATLNISNKGTRVTTSLPKTGISYSSYTPHHENQTPTDEGINEVPTPNNPTHSDNMDEFTSNTDIQSKAMKWIFSLFSK